MENLSEDVHLILSNLEDARDEGDWDIVSKCIQDLENVYENHVDWYKLINNDDNYKNKLQVIIQKEFKITPEYIELKNPREPLEEENDKNYSMGVYICIGQNIHTANLTNQFSLRIVFSGSSLSISDLAYSTNFFLM